MGEVVSLSDRMKANRQPWVAYVAIRDESAELETLAGEDSWTVSQRCIEYAQRLERLAARFRETAAAIDAEPSDA